MENELNLFDFIIVLLKNKKRLLINFLAITIAAIIISLIFPKTYSSDFTFIPPGPSNGNIFSMLGNSMNADIIGGSKLSKRQYISLLNSRELREQLIKKFDLVHVYKLSKRSDALDLALKRLDKAIIIKEEEEGGFGITDVITINVMILDNKAQRAADMANYLFGLLEEKSLVLSRSEYFDLCNFLSGEIAVCDTLLSRSRKTLKDFQVANKVYDVSTQVSMAMQTLGNYEAEIMMLQKEKAFLQNTNASSFSEVKNIDDRISTLQTKVNEVENKSNADLLPGLKLSLDLSNRYVDLLKEVETALQVQMMLRQQYEMAQIKAKKNYSGIYLVDRARPAQRKYKPKRAYIVLSIVIPYLLLLITWLFLMEHYQKVKTTSPQKLAKIEAIVQNLRFSKK